MEKKFKRTTVTSALPYANGPVHIGHLAGVYVPADIYVRYLRLKKEDVIFIGGSDEHGVPITIRAKKEGITPQDVVDRYHTLIKKSFEEFGVSFDVYSRTTSKTHHDTASDFFRKLYDKEEFIEKTSMQYYDEEAKTFLADRYITGECPHCHAEGAYGDQCEKCGTSLSPTDLINPKSAISGSQPVMRETKHWYLPLDKHDRLLPDAGNRHKTPDMDSLRREEALQCSTLFPTPWWTLPSVSWSCSRPLPSRSWTSWATPRCMSGCGWSTGSCLLGPSSAFWRRG